MAKWKCEICGSEFENYQAQGFNHKIYCPLCYFKELYKREKQENQQLKKQKDDVVEYIKYQLSNLDFEKYRDMKAKMLGSMILVMLEDNRMLGEIDG